MATISVSVTTSPAQAKIGRLLKAVTPETLLTVIGGRLLSYVDESFRTRGRGQWKPLSPLTLLMRQHGGDMPLQDTGQLKASYVQETDNQTYVEIGSNQKVPGGILSLAAIHEYGTSGPYPIHSQTRRDTKGNVTRKGGFASLAAKLRDGGYIFFGPIVMHPGVPARPVLPAKAVADRLIQQTLDEMLRRVDAPGFGADLPAVFRRNR